MARRERNEVREALEREAGSVGDVPGEMRRTYAVHSDPDLLKGFPRYLGDSGEASPKMADLDGDGVLDLIYPTGGGMIHAVKITPIAPAASSATRQPYIAMTGAMNIGASAQPILPLTP